MPRSGLPFGPAATSTSAGFLAGSALYVDSVEPAPPPTARTELPSAVNDQVIPGGRLTSLPSSTEVSAAHSPTKSGGSFLRASFAAMAAARATIGLAHAPATASRVRAGTPGRGGGRGGVQRAVPRAGPVPPIG